MYKSAFILFVWSSLGWSYSAGSYMNHYEIVEKFQNLTNESPGAERLRLSPVPESRDYRYRDTPVKKQIGQRSSAYGLIAAMENVTGSPQSAALSEAHLWSHYQKDNSKLALKAALNNEITAYEFWPHDKKRPYKGYEEIGRARLSHFVDIRGDVQSAVSLLHDGYPIYLGTKISNSMGRCDDVLHPKSKVTQKDHALAAVGYGLDDSVPGGGYFILKNSWGKECGDGGYQYLPFSHCLSSNQNCKMWAVTGVRHKFEDLDEIQPPFVPFNPKKVFIKIESSKKWWQAKPRLQIYFSGDSVHLNQITKVRFELEGTGIEKSFQKHDHNSVWRIKSAFTGRVNAWVETTWGSYDFGALVE